MDIARDNGYGLAKNSLWPWISATLLVSVVLLVAVFMHIPALEKSWHSWTRYTARLSFFLFLAAYLAAPLYELVKNPATAWLRRQRRNSGIGFGIAHTIHLAALIGFYQIADIPAEMPTVIVGGGAYLAMFLMLATSNDAALRRLGKTNWRWLHKFGAHYLAVVFAFTYLSQFLGGLNKPPILLILAIAAIVVRIFITLKSRWEAS